MIKVSWFSESTFCFSVSFTFRNVSKNTPVLLHRCSLKRVDANIGILNLTDASLWYRPTGRKKPSRSNSNASAEPSSGLVFTALPAPNLPAAGSWSSGHICLGALGPDAQRPERWPGVGIQAAGRPEMDTRTNTSGDMSYIQISRCWLIPWIPGMSVSCVYVCTRYWLFSNSFFPCTERRLSGFNPDVWFSTWSSTWLILKHTCTHGKRKS